MVFNKDNKKEISAIEDLIDARIYVNPKRFEELSKLKDDIWSRELDATREPCTLLCLNLSAEVENCLRSVEGYNLHVEQISEDPADPTHKVDRRRFLKLFGGTQLEQGGVGAIVHQLRGEEPQLSLLDRRVIALSLLNKLPVLVLVPSGRGPEVLLAARAASGDTWPVFTVADPQEDMRPVCQWLSSELPRVRALSAAIQEDLRARVAHLSRVNAPLHFLSRASVALVPFGVMTVNFLGILRLMANMLLCVGMMGDTSANKSLGLLGAKNAAFVSAIDSIGDVYSFAVFSTVLADLQGLSLTEAADAMEVLDGLMLGSISVVTGAVSALGAYLSRPRVVRAAAEFLASLQTIYALNPAMRREGERRPPKRGVVGKNRRKGRKAQEASEGLLGRLERSTNGRTSSLKDAEAAAVVTAAHTGDGEERTAEGRGRSSSSSGGSSEEDPEEGGAHGDSEASDEGDEGEWGAAASSGPELVVAACKGGEAEAAVGEDSTGGAKPSRRQVRQQAAAQRQAVKTAKAAAKAAAKAEKAAVKLRERESRRQEKQWRREQKAAERAAAKLAKARGASALLDTEAPALVDEPVSAAEPISPAGAAAAAAKTSWWRRRKSAAAAVATEAVATASGEDTGASSSDEGGEEGRGAEAGLGLDDDTCRALVDFLNVPDEEAYDMAAELPESVASDGNSRV